VVENGCATSMVANNRVDDDNIISTTAEITPPQNNSTSKLEFSVTNVCHRTLIGCQCSMYNPDNVEEKVHLAVTKQYSVCVCVCLSKLAYLFYNFLSTVINGLFIGANANMT